MKIIILEYSTGNIYIKDYDMNLYSNDEKFLEDNGFRIKDCNWMITDDININIE